MEILNFALMSAGSLFAIINPLAAVPTFFAMTPENTEAERLRMARTACITATGVLMLFALTGNALFSVFGITIAAFQMAGGLLLLLVSLDNLRAKRSGVQETEEEKAAGAERPTSPSPPSPSPCSPAQAPSPPPSCWRPRPRTWSMTASFSCCSWW